MTGKQKTFLQNCPQCGRPVRFIRGHNGPFLGCSGYKEFGCRFTMQLSNDEVAAMEQAATVPKTIKSLTEQVEALEQRVAALERLLMARIGGQPEPVKPKATRKPRKPKPTPEPAAVSVPPSFYSGNGVAPEFDDEIPF